MTSPPGVGATSSRRDGDTHAVGTRSVHPRHPAHEPDVGGNSSGMTGYSAALLGSRLSPYFRCCRHSPAMTDDYPRYDPAPKVPATGRRCQHQARAVEAWAMQRHRHHQGRSRWSRPPAPPRQAAGASKHRWRGAISRPPRDFTISSRRHFEVGGCLFTRFSSLATAVRPRSDPSPSPAPTRASRGPVNCGRQIFTR